MKPVSQREFQLFWISVVVVLALVFAYDYSIAQDNPSRETDTTQDRSPIASTQFDVLLNPDVKVGDFVVSRFEIHAGAIVTTGLSNIDSRQGLPPAVRSTVPVDEYPATLRWQRVSVAQKEDERTLLLLEEFRHQEKDSPCFQQVLNDSEQLSDHSNWRPVAVIVVKQADAWACQIESIIPIQFDPTSGESSWRGFIRKFNRPVLPGPNAELEDSSVQLDNLLYLHRAQVSGVTYQHQLDAEKDNFTIMNWWLGEEAKVYPMRVQLEATGMPSLGTLDLLMLRTDLEGALGGGRVVFPFYEIRLRGFGCDLSSTLVAWGSREAPLVELGLEPLSSLKSPAESIESSNRARTDQKD